MGHDSRGCEESGRGNSFDGEARRTRQSGVEGSRLGNITPVEEANGRDEEK